MKIDQLQTPCYVIDEKKMRENLEILKKVQEDTGCKILLAQKAFSGFALYPMIGKYLAGTTASGLFEARLGYEEMGKENHVFSPAYRTEDIEELNRICDHIIFNSTAQLKKFKKCVPEPVWDSVLIRNAPLRGIMRSMIPVRRVPGWGLPERTLTWNV